MLAACFMRRKNLKEYTYLLIAVTSIFYIFGSLKDGALRKSPSDIKNESSLPQTAVVTRAIDGDTIVIDTGCRVRYIGVDTPETKHPKRVVEFFGKEASEYNKKLVTGKKARLEYDVQKSDRYGRLLAYVYVGDTFVNAELVKEGYAQIYTMPPNVKHAELFLRLERNARAMKKGLWLTK